jgi:hypothetical protein
MNSERADYARSGMDRKPYRKSQQDGPQMLPPRGPGSLRSFGPALQ